MRGIVGHHRVYVRVVFQKGIVLQRVRSQEAVRLFSVSADTERGDRQGTLPLGLNLGGKSGNLAAAQLCNLDGWSGACRLRTVFVHPLEFEREWRCGYANDAGPEIFHICIDKYPSTVVHAHAIDGATSTCTDHHKNIWELPVKTTFEQHVRSHHEAARLYRCATSFCVHAERDNG